MDEELPSSRAHFAFVIDDEVGICHFMALTLAKLDFEVASFQTAKEALAALDQRRPQIIFLDVALKKSDAVDVIHGLNERKFTGVVQLISGGNPVLLEAVQRIGARQGMTLLPPLLKPFRREAIVQVVAGLALAG